MKNYLALSLIALTSLSFGMETININTLKQQFRQEYNKHYPYLKEDAQSTRSLLSSSQDRRPFIRFGNLALFSEHIAEQIAFRDRSWDTRAQGEEGEIITITTQDNVITLKGLLCRMFMASFYVTIQKKGVADKEDSGLFINNVVQVIDQLYDTLTSSAFSPHALQTSSVSSR